MQQAAPLTEPPVRAIPSPAPPAPANPPRMKGYSSPGASDSASAEGSFTQLFRTVTPSPAPLPRIQPLAAQASSSPPAVEKTEWPRFHSEISGGNRPFSRALWARGVTRRIETPPGLSHSPTYAGPPAPGSVTMWIQKLSEDVERPQRSRLLSRRPRPQRLRQVPFQARGSIPVSSLASPHRLLLRCQRFKLRNRATSGCGSQVNSSGISRPGGSREADQTAGDAADPARA